MRTKFTFTMLAVVCTVALGFSQNNRSNGTVLTTITPPVPAFPATTTEVFRFRPGLVTQLDSGVGFDFTPASQWFSLGKLTPSATAQTLYGFRIQRAGRGLVFGYSGANQSGGTPTTPGNAFIQWVGNNVGTTVTPGNLEFRTSPSSTNPASDRLAFTLRSDLTALFGETPSAGLVTGTPKVEIISQSFGNQVGLLVSTSGGSGGAQSRAAYFRSNATGGGTVDNIALETFSDGSNTSNYGVKASTGYGSQNNYGFSSFVGNLGPADPVTQPSRNYGYKALVNSPDVTSSNYGVFSDVVSNSATGSVNCGIFATASGFQSTVAGPIGNYAGYFGGTVYATQGFFGSDASLKRDIKKEESALEKLAQLNPVTYNFIENDKSLKLGLPANLQHGFIAQELQEVYPELVADILHPMFNGNNEQIGTKSLKAVNYVGLISVLTQSLKELSSEVTTLKAKLETAEKTYVISNYKDFTQSELDAIADNSYYLGQNTPNPFKTSTIIDYSLPEGEKDASILLLNLNGQTLREFKLNDVKGSITIESSSLQKGMYLYSLISNGKEIATKKMIVN
jgi:Chaperone of endosialidase/Secretion system C-terminal sorting domain